MIKVIIAGGRDFCAYEKVVEAMVTLFADIECPGDYTFPDDMEIVSGTARGADQLGERFADERKINLKLFPADWDTHGKAAGIIRNNEMAEYADVLVAFWDGESRGTKNMIETALTQGLEVHVYRY